MALDNVTSHFSTVLEPITSASFPSCLSIIHDLYVHRYGRIAGQPQGSAARGPARASLLRVSFNA